MTRHHERWCRLSHMPGDYWILQQHKHYARVVAKDARDERESFKVEVEQMLDITGVSHHQVNTDYRRAVLHTICQVRGDDETWYYLAREAKHNSRVVSLDRRWHDKMVSDMIVNRTDLRFCPPEMRIRLLGEHIGLYDPRLAPTGSPTVEGS